MNNVLFIEFLAKLVNIVKIMHKKSFLRDLRIVQDSKGSLK